MAKKTTTNKQDSIWIYVDVCGEISKLGYTDLENALNRILTAIDTLYGTGSFFTKNEEDKNIEITNHKGKTVGFLKEIFIAK